MEQTAKSKNTGMGQTLSIILVIGVCASVAFYVLTNMTVSVTLTEWEAKRKDSAKTLVVEEFSRLDESMKELKGYVEHSSLDDIKYNPNEKRYYQNFSSVFWIDAKSLSLSSKPTVTPLWGSYKSRDLKWYLNAENTGVLKSYYKTFSKKDLGVIKSIGIKPIIEELPANQWSRKSGAVVLATLLKLRDGNVGILFAVAESYTVFNQFYLYETLGLSSIQILDSRENYTIFETVKNSYQSKVNAEKSLYSLMHADFNRAYRVNLRLAETYESMWLGMLPTIILIISLFLTSVYMLLRYFGIKRSVEMQDLNIGLANKNIALKTEIKKREKMNMAVRQSEQENRAIINSIKEVIFELDQDGNLCFINDTWRRVTGYELSESIGKSVFSYMSNEQADEQKTMLSDLVQSKIAAYSTSFRLQTKGGSDKPVEMSMSMMRQDKDKNLRVVGTLTDLAEREKAEQAIEEAEENYKRIWKNAANGIYELDLNGKLLSANPAMAQTLGYDDTEQLIREVTNMSEMVYVNPNEKNEKLEALKDSPFQRFEIQAYRGNEEKIWLNESIQPVLDDEGNITHYEGSIEDITDRKNADIALMKAKAESDMANRAKSDFLANMSHELRTPLNSIMGFAEIIRDQVMGEIKEPVYSEYAGEIHKSGTGLLSIINQILDVSKIESGDRELNESLVKLEKVSKDTLQLFSEKIKEKQITIENNVDDQFGDLISEDRSVRQMLYNVVSNAVKFTPAKGTIKLSVTTDMDNIRISVKDTGEGLTPEELERALKPFDLLDGEHSREKYGAGLGLTLVKLLMDMHGGHIDMQSEKGSGTQVCLVFPISRLRKRKTQKVEEDTKKEDVVEADVVNFDEADVFDTSSNSVH